MHNEEGFKLHNLLQKHGFQNKFGAKYSRGHHNVYIGGSGAWNYTHSQTKFEKPGKGEKDLDAHLKKLTEGSAPKNLREVITEARDGDDEAAHALVLHGDNEAHLYHTSKHPVMKNLEKKHKNGSYDHEKAKKLWKYHADKVAQHYHHEHGDPRQHWAKAFPPRVRHRAATMWADDHHAEMKHGNYQ